MKEVFDMIDTDGSGNLSLEEVLLYLKSITDDISEENLEKIFEGIDTSGDKVVDFDEFKVFAQYIYQNLLSVYLGSDGPTDGEGLEQAEQPGGGEGGGGQDALQSHRQGRQRGALARGQPDLTSIYLFLS